MNILYHCDIHPKSHAQSIIEFIYTQIPEIEFHIDGGSSQLAYLDLFNGIMLELKKLDIPHTIRLTFINDKERKSYYYDFVFGSPKEFHINEIKRLYTLISRAEIDQQKESKMINLHPCNNTYVTANEAIELIRQGINVKASHKLNKNIVDASSLPLIEFVSKESNFEFYIPPKFIKIGDIEVPRPLDYLPLPNITVYYPDPYVTGLVDKTVSSTLTKTDIKTNMFHLTKESAYVHSQALILISGGTLSIENES